VGKDEFCNEFQTLNIVRKSSFYMSCRTKREVKVTEAKPHQCDDEIGQLLADLRREHDDGDIKCLAIAVVRPTGELTTVITGWAANSVLLGAIELLKIPLLKKELQRLDSPPCEARLA
jgi:hypothetical protein